MTTIRIFAALALLNLLILLGDVLYNVLGGLIPLIR